MRVRAPCMRGNKIKAMHVICDRAGISDNVLCIDPPCTAYIYYIHVVAKVQVSAAH